MDKNEIDKKVLALLIRPIPGLIPLTRTKAVSMAVKDETVVYFGRLEKKGLPSIMAPVAELPVDTMIHNTHDELTKTVLQFVNTDTQYRGYDD